MRGSTRPKKPFTKGYFRCPAHSDYMLCNQWFGDVPEEFLCPPCFGRCREEHPFNPKCEGCCHCQYRAILHEQRFQAILAKRTA